MSIILTKDQAYLEWKQKEYQKVKGVFAKRLGQILSIMPVPARVFNGETGEWTVINDPKWQALIDKNIEMANDFLQKEFPELNIQTPTNKQTN